MARRSLSPLLLFALACLLVPALFVYHHLNNPSDGVRLESRTGADTGPGFVLLPYDGYSGPLREGDVLIAVNGFPLEARAAALFLGDWRDQVYETGQPQVYSIVRQGKPMEVKVELGLFPWKAVLAEFWGILLFILLAQGIATFILLKRPGDLAGQILFIWAFSGSHTYTWSIYLQVSDLFNGFSYWLYTLSDAVLWFIFWSSMVHLLLVFPRRLVTRAAGKIVMPLLYIAPFLLDGAYLAGQYLAREGSFPWWNFLLTGQYLVAAALMVAGVLLFSYQYLSARSEAERIKTGWLMLGGISSLALGLVLYFLPNIFFGRPFLSPNGLGLINFPFIITLGIAIWRHSLFDINIIIRRTLVYGLLTTFLVFLHVGLVTTLQVLASQAGIQQSSGVIVVTTLFTAALFNPLRRRFQGAIDRRFYRKKYNAEQSLSDFARFASRETDLDRLAGELTEVVKDTLQPDRVDLWLSPKPGDEPGSNFSRNAHRNG